VSRGGRLTAKGQAYTLHRCKGRTSEQREQADDKEADSHPMQVQRRTTEQWEQANGKGADSHTMQVQKEDQ
jgi:hypothetical protein